jgi:hypothetical protein
MPDPVRSSQSSATSYLAPENQCTSSGPDESSLVCAAPLPAGAQSLVEKHYASSPPPAPTEPFDAPHSGSVWLCARPAQVAVLEALGLEHRWLMTTNKEAGMGAVGEGVPGDHVNLPFVTQTGINDHTGEHAKASAHCEPVANVDEACVDEKLAIGKPLGRWAPSNQCHTFAEAVLNECTPRSIQNDGAEGAPGY